LSEAFNEAWVGIAILFALMVIAVPFVPQTRRAERGERAPRSDP
jgi:hypothetical protein